MGCLYLILGACLKVLHAGVGMVMQKGKQMSLGAFLFMASSVTAAISQEIGLHYINARNNHAAWGLLASRRAPLVLSCLRSLLKDNRTDIAWEDAVEQLAGLFSEYVNASEFELQEEDLAAAAQKELRGWVKKRLVVEREGKLLGTDALQKAFDFVESLNTDGMTSTASRLATVQREIENLQARLNPNREDRMVVLKKRIAEMQQELAQVERGEFEVLQGAKAVEGIRDIYQLAISLRLDFRRVEDSFREADRQLRQDIIRSDQDRGNILNSLLEGHDTLLSTAEGQVFDAFYEQLSKTLELDQMRMRVLNILDNADARVALNAGQRRDLRNLTDILLRESERILQARARGEKDVQTFIKAGIGSEHLKVGRLLTELMETASHIDWSVSGVRKKPAPLPPIAIGVVNVHAVQRLRVQEQESGKKFELDLSTQSGALNDMPEDFWEAFDSLDRQQLYEDTVELLKSAGRPMTLAELAEAVRPRHDLETLTYWMSLAREAEIPFDGQTESMVIIADDIATRFTVPLLALDWDSVEKVSADVLG